MSAVATGSGTRLGLRDVSVGRLLLTAGALFTPVGAFLADWNDTHVSNDAWPPHAKFHNAQTITLAVVASAAALWQLWAPGPATRDRLRRAVALGSLFWLTQVPAPFFPGSAVVDPDAAQQPFDVLGIPVNQITATAVVLAPLLGGGYALAVRRLPAQSAAEPRP